MTSDATGRFPCQHRTDLAGSERVQALRVCLDREDRCPLWQAVYEEVWRSICVERRYQYLPDDSAQTRNQVARVMVEVRRCVQAKELQAKELLEELLDLQPNRVVTEDLMAGLRRRDEVAARANSLWLVARSMRECGHTPSIPRGNQTLTDARETIVGRYLSGKEHELVLAMADQVEMKCYIAVGNQIINETFDGWRATVLHRTKIDILHLRRPPDAAHFPSSDGQTTAGPDLETGTHQRRPDPRNALTFSELARDDAVGREGLLPAEVARMPASDLPPDEEVIQRERRLALNRAIIEFAIKTWKDPVEAKAKARILYARLLEGKEYNELAASENAQRYKLSAHAIEMLAWRAKKYLAQDTEIQQLYVTSSDTPSPPAEGDTAGTTQTTQ